VKTGKNQEAGLLGVVSTIGQNCILYFSAEPTVVTYPVVGSTSEINECTLFTYSESDLNKTKSREGKPYFTIAIPHFSNAASSFHIVNSILCYSLDILIVDALVCLFSIFVI